MALDHYVSQVHLKNFYSPAMAGLMYAIRKSDLKRFPTKSQDVCRIEEGSTNAFLTRDRAIEEFLKDVEPRYNASVAKLRENKMDQEAVASLAGFAAYVVACSPTAMRLHSGPLKAQLEAAAAILDEQGLIPKAPEVLGEKSITELLADGTVKFTVDPKYPQAIAIANILHHTSVFGNSPWEILHNGEAESPFFTSDYPAAIETFDINTPINRIVPLAPDIAVRIKPDRNLSGTKPDVTFAKFKATSRYLKRAEVLEINRLLVRCAEDMIFFRDDGDWIESFVAKNRHYRIEPVTNKLPHASGHVLISTHRILARPE
ncbi:DUF4238 domain-containing protein [Bradyrhizobium sp. 183]|uniref:DUF4238 domain-containing protein n=1 Tax=unclassified Bradyrhizobium TaxID=2631580 RepID=UPI001FFE3E3C|nr:MULTISPECIES: DUF4238 domain-containing protein [unclassified Bradyrhizobium]UPJ78802.1 DUF4238 domain-containing protein [Bradyrhizobium sp. 184]UPJ86595.1 DUF4238 domain-containing protein [Bradyrhizobium sp. 183]